MTDPTRFLGAESSPHHPARPPHTGQGERGSVAPLDHAPTCKRRRPPLLAHDLIEAPVYVCPECCASAPAPDTRPTNPKETQ